MKTIHSLLVVNLCAITASFYLPLDSVGEEAKNLVKEIFEYVDGSDLARYKFSEVEDATHAQAKTVPPPSGYLKGMALTYALSYHDLLHVQTDEFLVVMVKGFGDGNDPLRDMASTERRDYFEGSEGWLSNTTDEGRLQNLFAILIELGVRESFGNCYEGLDPNNTAAAGEANQAETGLFQVSWNYYLNSRSGRSFLGELKRSYSEGDRADSFSLLPIFLESAGEWKNSHGTADSEGWQFQELTKRRPRFAVEFMALCLRSLPRGTHFKEWKDGGSVNERGYNVFLRDYGFELPSELTEFLKGVVKIVNQYEGDPDDFESDMGKWFSEAT